MNETMLDVLKSRMHKAPKLSIKHVKELCSKYKITFAYESNLDQSNVTTVDLPKCCTPKHENYSADQAIITAMSTILINRGEIKLAKLWLDKLHAGLGD